MPRRALPTRFLDIEAGVEKEDEVVDSSEDEDEDEDEDEEGSEGAYATNLSFQNWTDFKLQTRVDKTSMRARASKTKPKPTISLVFWIVPVPVLRQKHPHYRMITKSARNNYVESTTFQPLPPACRMMKTCMFLKCKQGFVIL